MTPPSRTQTADRRPAVRLSREDWLAAGQDILREEGIAGVKLRPLLERLGVTTGSFYHHFRDITEYHDALADTYGSENVDRVMALTASVNGAARLAEMWRLAQEWEIPPLDRAMRVWATSSERAAAAVRRLDEQLLQVIRDAFTDLGFSEPEARARALLVFSAGAGNPIIFSPWPDDPEIFALALQVVVAPLPAAP